MSKCKTQISRLTTLPTSLVDEINGLQLSKIRTNQCFYFVDLLLYNSFKTNKNFFNYYGIPAIYLEKVFSKKYKEVIQPLLELGIIERNYYIIGKKTYEYRVNSDFFQSEDTKKVAYSVKVKFEESKYDVETLKGYYKEDITQLVLPTDKMTELAERLISNISISDFRTNDQIKEPTIYVTCKEGKNEFSYSTSTTKALATAKEKGYTLIQDKHRYYLMNADRFITEKIYSSRLYYQDAIDKLKTKYWYVNRNTTNSRLDTNLTNLCGELKKMIIEENNLVQFDLSNSQFALLAHNLPNDQNQDDIKLFKQLSYSGELYTYIKEVLSLESRSEAKRVTFELLFSSHKNKNNKIKELAKVFPNVLQYIKDYKIENGDKNFAIALQKKEAKIFIDYIYTELKKQGYFLLTVHDSVICKAEDAEYIYNFITDYFKSINFEGQLTKD